VGWLPTARDTCTLSSSPRAARTPLATTPGGHRLSGRRLLGASHSNRGSTNTSCNPENPYERRQRVPSLDDRLDTQRETLRQPLDVLASDVSMAFRDVGLDFAVFLTVPHRGHSLATIATALDPSDADWRTVGSMTEAVSKQMNSFEEPWGELLEAIR
jgi:hypothetical protein